MAIVEWSTSAQFDIEELTRSLLERLDVETTGKIISAILAKADSLGDTRFLGQKVGGVKENYRIGYALKSTYKIYYWVKDHEHIKILYVSHSRQQPPTSKELRKAART